MNSLLNTLKSSNKVLNLFNDITQKGGADVNVQDTLKMLKNELNIINIKTNLEYKSIKQETLKLQIKFIEFIDFFLKPDNDKEEKKKIINEILEDARNLQTSLTKEKITDTNLKSAISETIETANGLYQQNVLPQKGGVRKNTRRRVTRRRDTRRRDTRRRVTRRRVTRRRDTRRRVTRRRDTRRRVTRRRGGKGGGSVSKDVFIEKKGDKKDLRIFVINLKRNKDRWKKYAEYNKKLPSSNYVKYEKFDAVDGNYLRKNQKTKEDKMDKKYFEKIIMMWNAGEKQKGNVIGCLLSHLRLMRKIISKKLNNVLVIEDDALVDMALLKKTNLNKLPQDKMIYFGGVLRPLTFKDQKFKPDNVRKSFKKNTVNKIKANNFKIGSTHGLYYPTKEAAKPLLKYLEGKERIRAIDSELAFIQKKEPGLIDSIFYPAIVYLVLEEAQQGFSGQYFKKDGFDRTMKYY